MASNYGLQLQRQLRNAVVPDALVRGGSFDGVACEAEGLEAQG